MKFGVNVNTRVPLIYPSTYDSDKLLDLARASENSGYDSVWVGDSILAKPRLDPLAVLSSVATVTSKVKLGTACMIAPLRNPILLARTWATLDLLSHGRTIMAVCVGPGTTEYDKLGIKYGNRGRMLEEYVQLLRKLWAEDHVTFQGKYYNVSDITLNPKPVQRKLPIQIVGWPYSHGGHEVKSEESNPKLMDAVFSRVAKHGDGWMFDGFATPENVADGIERLKASTKSAGRDSSELDIVYQMTMNLNSTSREEAVREGKEYLLKYYGDLSRPLDSWGPFGTADDCIDRIERFKSAGVKTIVLRFASSHQADQFSRFTKEVLPSFN